MDDGHVQPSPPNACSPSQTRVTAVVSQDEVLQSKLQRKRGRTEQETEIRKQQKNKNVKRTFSTNSKPNMKIAPRPVHHLSDSSSRDFSKVVF